MESEKDRKYKAVKENVAGDFYVQNGCCTLCGVPHVEAPSLFGGIIKDYIGNKIFADQCYVKKQPTSDSEIQLMVNAMATQDTGCIRYGGRYLKIIEMLINCGEKDSIDYLTEG